jgi:predicted  nucleic acid-binding Zn-ribbon protein
MINEKIRIKCTKCNSVFRERSGRIRDGFQLNCPECNRLITFDATSDDPNVRKAFKTARDLRHAQEADVFAASRSEPTR